MKKETPFKYIWIAIIITWSLVILWGYFFNIGVNLGSDLPSSSKSVTIFNQQISFFPSDSHSYYFNSIKSNIISKDAGKWKMSPLAIIVSLLVLIYLIFVINEKRKGKARLKINAPPIYLFILFTTLFFAFYLASVWYNGLSNINYLNVVTGYFKIVGSISIIILLALSIGKKIYFFVEKSEERDLLTLFLFSIGLGVIAITFFTFLLGAVGQINQRAAIILLLLLFAFSIKETVFWLKNLFIRSIKIDAAYFSPQVFLFGIIAIFSSFNFLVTWRPIPLYHDDLELYMNTTKLLATQGKLLGGIRNYPWELFMGFTLALFKNVATTLTIWSGLGIMAVCSIIGVIKTYCKKRGIDAGYYPLLMAGLFYTLPAVYHQATLEMKTDLAAFFFAMLSFLLFWKWRDEIRNRQYLFLASFLMGFAFVIKATIVLFGGPIFLYLMLFLYKKRIASVKSLVLCLMCFSFFALPFVPFAIKNAIEISSMPSGKVNYASISEYASVMYGASKERMIILTKNEILAARKNGEIYSSYLPSELGRYAGNEKGLRKLIFLPMIVTFNDSVSGYYVDISFVFLLFVPLLVPLLYLTRSKEKTNPYIFNEILILGISFWLLWAKYASGIIWYGFPGFIFLSIIIIEMLCLFKKSRIKFLTAFFNLILIFWFFLTLVLQVNNNLPGLKMPANLNYASAKIDESEYLNISRPRIYPVISVLNPELDNRGNNQMKVYVAGKYVSYFIHENNELVYSDTVLAAYAAISDGKNGSGVIDRLKGAGFKYIIVEQNDIPFFGESAPFMHEKLESLVKTVRNNPAKIKVRLDDKNTGVIFAEIL